MLIGYFDIAIVFLLIIGDIIIWKYPLIENFDWKIITITILLLFALIPYISTKVERFDIKNAEEMIDGFNLLYIFFRYPLWWTLGTIEILTLKGILKKKNNNELH